MKSGIYPKDSVYWTISFRFFHESEHSKLLEIVHRHIRAKYGNFAFITGLPKATVRLESARQPSDSLVYFHL